MKERYRERETCMFFVSLSGYICERERENIYVSLSSNVYICKRETGKHICLFPSNFLYMQERETERDRAYLVEVMIVNF